MGQRSRKRTADRARLGVAVLRLHELLASCTRRVRWCPACGFEVGGVEDDLSVIPDFVGPESACPKCGAFAWETIEIHCRIEA